MSKGFQLPQKPSELILLALQDLEKAEKDPNYRVDMNFWHMPDIRLRSISCAVCMAGSTMAFTLGSPIEKTLIPGSFSVKNENALIAIDDFRNGEIFHGCKTLGIAKRKIVKIQKAFSSWDSYLSLNSGFFRIETPEYGQRSFKKTMRKMADTFASVGA